MKFRLWENGDEIVKYVLLLYVILETSAGLSTMPVSAGLKGKDHSEPITQNPEIPGGSRRDSATYRTVAS